MWRFSGRRPSSVRDWSSRGKASPPPNMKRQKVLPCSVGPVPTSGRAARPEPRKNVSRPAISTSIAIHSRFSSFCSVLPGVPAMRSTSEISAELVEMADETKMAPSSLLRDQSGTLVAVSKTPV